MELSELVSVYLKRRLRSNDNFSKYFKKDDNEL